MNPGYPLAQANTLKDGKMATAGYVKGAYNAAIKAVNRVSADTATALSGKQDTISDLSDIRSGAEAGTSAVTAIGDMTELEVEDADTLVEAINAIKTATDSALTASSLEDYATTDDVADAINSATASTTVGVVTTWGTDAESEIVLTGSVAVAAAASSAASSGL